MCCMVSFAAQTWSRNALARNEKENFVNLKFPHASSFRAAETTDADSTGEEGRGASETFKDKNSLLR